MNRISIKINTYFDNYFRATLDRAVLQKIPLKKMRTLFKKYVEFEEKYGTPELVNKVKLLAANYVQQEIDN